MSSKNLQDTCTPLDSLRRILSDFVPNDEDFVRHLSHKLGEIRKNSLPMIADYLKKPGMSALRKAVLPVISKHDWPEWSGLLYEVLSKEPELNVFDEGCAALGALGTKSSWKTLQRLKTVRTDRDRQIILDREIKELEAHQPLSYYIGRVLEGDDNPRLATVGSRMVAVLAGPQDVSAMIEAFQNGDKLAKRLLMRIFPCIACSETENFLAYTLRKAALDLVECHTLEEIIRRVSAMPRPTARQECQNLVIEHYRNQSGEIVSELNSALGQQDAETASLFDALEEATSTHIGSFALQALRLLVEGKLAMFSVFLSERSEENEKSLEDTALVLDQAAEALARLVKEGGAKTEDAIPFFRDVFNMRLGGNVFLDSYVELVTHQDTEILDEFLADPDFNRRFVILNAIGAKEDERFVDFFLKAVNDSIVDVGQVAVQHLGRLRKGQEIFLDYFKSGEREKMRLAVWGFKEIRLSEAADLLLDYIIQAENDSASVRNDILIEVVKALANLRIEKATPIFLQLLHDGQPLSMQTVLAEALAALELEEAALGLLSKAKNLRHAEVLFTALEGSLIPFSSFEHPFPMEHFEDMQSLLDRCCGEREGEGQSFRALCAMENLYVLDITVYEKLGERLSDYLSHLRAKENWDKEANDRLSAIVKELAKRCESLRQLNQKESELTTLMERTAQKGPVRTETLLTLRTKLEDPNLIIKAEMAKTLGDYVQTQLKVAGQEWRDIAHLCEIAGICRRKELIEPIRAIYSRSTGLGLKSAAKNALIKLGLTEADINRRKKITNILVLEPSAFFRKRLVDALKDSWTVRDAGSMEEAEKMLEEKAAELLVSEYISTDGGMLNWFQAMMDKNAFHYVYLCTSNRDLSQLGEPPWLIGILHKPFPVEKLIEDLRD